MELSYQVDRDHAGCCVRQAARGPMHLSEKLWRKIKWNGTITVNGSPVSSPSHRLGRKSGGDSRPSAPFPFV